MVLNKDVIGASPHEHVHFYRYAHQVIRFKAVDETLKTPPHAGHGLQATLRIIKMHSKLLGLATGPSREVVDYLPLLDTVVGVGILVVGDVG
jgi:hypothetical protein